MKEDLGQLRNGAADQGYDLDFLPNGRITVPGVIEGKVITSKDLPALGKGNWTLRQSTVKTVKSATFKPGNGYRYLYVEELQNNDSLAAKVHSSLGAWDIVACVNGWTEGSGYGSKVVKDDGKRKIGNMIVISENYPVQIKK